MSLITWNPSDKHFDYVLSNNNLTAELIGSVGYRLIRASQGKTVKKWYFEVTVESTNDTAQTIGVCTIDTPYSNGTSLSGTPSTVKVYHRGGYTHHPTMSGLETYDAGDVIGVALDMDLGVVKFYKNSIYIAEITGLLGVANEFYPCLMSFPSLVNTANFGATEFDIVTSNPTAWNQLVSEGYQPYDVDNAGWLVLNKILILSADSQVIARDVTNENWVSLGNELTAQLFEENALESISDYTDADWQALYDNFQAPFKVVAWNSENYIPTVRQTVTEREFDVVGRVYEKELSENELEKIKGVQVN